MALQLGCAPLSKKATGDATACYSSHPCLQLWHPSGPNMGLVNSWALSRSFLCQGHAIKLSLHVMQGPIASGRPRSNMSNFDASSRIHHLSVQPTFCDMSHTGYARPCRIFQDSFSLNLGSQKGLMSFHEPERPAPVLVCTAREQHNTALVYTPCDPMIWHIGLVYNRYCAPFSVAGLCSVEKSSGIASAAKVLCIEACCT